MLNLEEHVTNSLIAFLSKPVDGQRKPFSFVTYKGTLLAMSVQVGSTYASSKDIDGRITTVEVLNIEPDWKFSEEFVNKYASYQGSTLFEFVPIPVLVQEILLVIRTL